MATGFETYKQIYNGCNCEHVSVGVFSCKRWGRSKRQVLQFLIQALLDVTLFQLVKDDIPQENDIAYIFRIEEWKERCLLFQSVITYFKIPSWFFKSLLVIRLKGPSNPETRIILRIIWNCCFFSCFIIDFRFVIRTRFSFTLCWKNHLDLGNFFVYFFNIESITNLRISFFYLPRVV